MTSSPAGKSLPPQEEHGQKKTLEEAAESPSNGDDGHKRRLAKVKESGVANAIWKVLTWTPKRCRWDIDDPPKFSMGLNLLFGFVSASICRSSYVRYLYEGSTVHNLCLYQNR